MYGPFGGCTSLLHTVLRRPILLAALGLTGLVSQVGSPGPGDRYGTDESLAQLEHQLITERSELAVQVVQLRTQFDRLNAEPTDDQIRQVLKWTDACTDVNVRDVRNNPDESREVAWILYLDAYSRHGQAVDLLFKSPPKE